MKKNYTHSKKFSEPVAQETQGSIHVGLNSAHRQLQLLCNVAVAHSVEITHTEHLPALLRQQIDGVVIMRRRSASSILRIGSSEAPL